MDASRTASAIAGDAWLAAEDAREAGRARGVLRIGMDYAVPPDDPADVNARLPTVDAALTFFDDRLTRAQEFLADRGAKGRVVAKLVTADIANIAGGSPVEHAEWQLFLVPDVADTLPTVLKGTAARQPPGLLDEATLDEWIASQGVAPRDDDAFLRCEDCPLFLGRLNYGTAGSGLYVRVPDYAERLGHAYDTREVKALVVTEAPQARRAIRALYTRLPGAYAVDGTCHQGAVVVAEALGIDPIADTAKLVDGLWATRLRYGRGGR